MKTILSVFLSLFLNCSFGQSVPDTETFTLQDVYNAVNYHSSPSQDLSSCFTNANPYYFDPNYGGLVTNYSNWFLPSSDELDAMYTNLKAYNVGGFGDALYWSSTEYSNYAAWDQSFISGTSYAHNKYTTNRVRAVRSFTSAAGAYSLRDTGPGGGLIFYVNGTTYYEAAASDQSTGYIWSNIDDVLIGGLPFAIGYGLDNTAAIISQNGHTTSAAKLCNDIITSYNSLLQFRNYQACLDNFGDLTTTWNLYVANKKLQEESTSFNVMLTFDWNGNNSYIFSQASDNIRQSVLSGNPYDLNVVSLTRFFYVGSESTNFVGIDFGANGTNMFLVMDASPPGLDGIYKYNLSTAWDISTASVDGFLSIYSVELPGGADNPVDLQFNVYGTVLWVLDADATIYRWTLPTAWDITTAIYTGQTWTNNDAGFTLQNPVGFFINDDGTKLYLLQNNGILHQLCVTTAYSLSTAKYTGQRNVSNSDCSAIHFSTGGTIFSILGSRLYTGDTNPSTSYETKTTQP